MHGSEPAAQRDRHKAADDRGKYEHAQDHAEQHQRSGTVALCRFGRHDLEPMGEIGPKRTIDAHEQGAFAAEAVQGEGKAGAGRPVLCERGGTHGPACHATIGLCPPNNQPAGCHGIADENRLLDMQRLCRDANPAVIPDRIELGRIANPVRRSGCFCRIEQVVRRKYAIRRAACCARIHSRPGKEGCGEHHQQIVDGASHKGGASITCLHVG